jgi:hypothetical protein
MGVFEYQSDDGTEYYVGLKTTKASEGGFTAAPANSCVDFPRGWRMRHVCGRESGGSTATLPIKAADGAKFVSGGTFSLNGKTYSIQGKIGERRINKV